ncbi:MAG TPA: pyridoxal-phosphate dependent enzyme [Verrucomicrobiae bacterium]|nr:pyridoxal-phosphate dependent enzyme [Verrucomicrobiae bacterium]
MDSERLRPPTITDVLVARARIRPHLLPTPLHRWPGLDQLVQAEVWVKHENHLPTGAFKVRGGVNLVACLDPDARALGVVAASTGNHGQSVAFAAQLFGVAATVYVPQDVNPVKADAIRSLGATVIATGRDFDDARLACEARSRSDGSRYIHSGNEPLLIAGVATATVEMIEAQPDLEVLIVPVGGGSAAAGACIAAKALCPGLEVIGVQAEAAPAAHRSWREGRLREAEMATFAEGLATRTAFALPQAILRQHLDDFVLVSEAQLRCAMRAMLRHTRNLVEAAGAAPLAAAAVLTDRLRGRRVALICSGGNVSYAQLRQLVADEA